MLAKCRRFFAERGILEVDCPMLSKEASVDAHIDLITATYDKRHTYYLHSSPEYGMKRLLSEGIGDIYQLSHVFRDAELGPKHNPEFMMAEWYRVGFSYQQMVDETCEFIRLFLGNLDQEQMTYRQAMVDYIDASDEDLRKLAGLPRGIYTRDELLNIILGLKVEPRLGKDKLTVITDYPKTQAALAKIENDCAKRFEVYYQGMELANGYDELCDADVQKQRFIEANKIRKEMGKEPLPIDHHFLKALKKGLPPCSGVAVGFDRLMMLRHGETTISDVMPLSHFS